jgi:phage shock protein C
MNARLYRSQTDRMLGGVCAGLAQYFGLDVSIIRIFFVLLAIGSGFGVIIYLILWIILPREDNLNTIARTIPANGEDLGDRVHQMADEFREAVRQPNTKAFRYLGAVLIGAGLLVFLQNLHLPWLRWLNADILWPVLLILAGIAFIYRAAKGDK